MGSQNIDLVPPQRLDNGLNSQMVFRDENLQFSRPPDRKMFSSDRERFFREDFQRNVYDSVAPRRDPPPSRQDWNGDGSTGTQEDDEDEDDDDDEEEEVEGEEEDGEGDGEVEGFVAVDVGIKSNSNNNNNNSSGSVQSSSEKIRNENASVQKNHSFGLNRLLMKDSGIVHSGNSIRGGLSEKQHQQGGMGHYENAITIAEPNIYYAQMLQGSDGSALAQKEAGGENGCGFSGRKYVSLSIESGESLRAILSDPITGTLMDDAMILVCGHSFGSGGMQHVMRMKSCYTCGHSISEDSVAPNLALRSAVQAFRREEELLSSRAPKRRRDRFEQDNCSYGDPVDSSRGKGVQFPFVVTDRVIIKGNKRTPQRFVGREAVVTTQCLNGWYVVKTLDNAESVKLQYRSLAKVPDSRTSDAMPSKTIVPNWL